MLKAIWAQSINGIIGDKNGLPWTNQKDMRHFRQTTSNSTVIMGYNTWLSLNQKPLPNRRNVVISRTPINGVITYTSVEECVKHEKNGWVIGGKATYEAFEPYLDGAVVTEIEAEYAGDTTAPDVLGDMKKTHAYFKSNGMEDNITIHYYER